MYVCVCVCLVGQLLVTYIRIIIFCVISSENSNDSRGNVNVINVYRQWNLIQTTFESFFIYLMNFTRYHHDIVAWTRWECIEIYHLLTGTRSCVKFVCAPSSSSSCLIFSPDCGLAGEFRRLSSPSWLSFGKGLSLKLLCEDAYNLKWKNQEKLWKMSKIKREREREMGERGKR